MSGAADFERSLDFDELLPARLLERAGGAIETLLGTPVRIHDASGTLRYGHEGSPDSAASVALSHDLEEVGTLTGAASREQLQAAATLLHTLMHANARYAMAASLHFQTVESSYRELQRRHTELQVSETRYRELAASLEQRVQEQVSTIEQAQRQLYQAEKLASVGQLAAGVAHEINNPLGFILSNLRSANNYLQDIAPLKGLCADGDPAAMRQHWQQAGLDFVLEDFSTLLHESLDGAARVARIVSSLKDFSSIDHADGKNVSIDTALRTVCELADPQIRPRAELLFEAGDLPAIACDAARINQALLNLLLNAADAMPAGRRGHIHVRTSLEGEWVRVDIRDDAGGIAPEVLPRIFDPFYTTHGVGAGTGLGLTVARDVINAHGGRITVDTRPGDGTTFSLFLPVHGNPA